MKTRHLLIALALAATSSAVLAQNIASSQVAGKSRAQVIDELKQAQAEGQVAVGDADYPVLPPFVSTRSRADVIAELKQAQAQGLVNVGDAYYPVLPAFVSTMSREQVVAELKAYEKNPDPQGLYRGY